MSLLPRAGYLALLSVANLASAFCTNRRRAAIYDGFGADGAAAGDGASALAT
jgi:hypothetical protein